MAPGEMGRVEGLLPTYTTKRSIIPQRGKPHLPAIAMDAMEQNGAPAKRELQDSGERS